MWFEELLEFCLRWFRSRRWRSLWQLAPMLVVSFSAITLVLLGLFTGREALADRYLTWIEESQLPASTGQEDPLRPVKPSDLDRAQDGNQPARDKEPEPPSSTAKSPTTEAASEEDRENTNPERERKKGGQGRSDANRDDALVKSDQVSPLLELYLRRILQLEEFNSRAVHLLAGHIGRLGRRGMARQMMRRVAPVDQAGYAPAHAWLAADRLMQENFSKAGDLTILMHDLAQAVKWGGAGDGLIRTYALLLASRQQVRQALAMLDDLDLSQRPRLLLLKAKMAADLDQARSLNSAETQLESWLAGFENSASKSAEYYAVAGSLALIRNEPKSAVKLAGAGIAQHPDATDLRVVQAEAFFQLYINESEQIEDDKKLTPTILGYLEAAMKSDPSNARVMNEVVRVATVQNRMSEDMKQVLERQLADGSASAMTHLLLANRFLTKGKYSNARTHFELALRQAPNSPVVMNNLALALIQSDPVDFERAEKLAGTALRIAGPNPFMFDTLGQVREAKGDTLGAIESYEKAVSLDKYKFNTRERLVAAYTELGMTDMANAQQKRMAELKREQQSEASGEAPK